MARKASPTILQEELYPLPGEPERGLDDARLVDLDVEEESPFLRGQKRVPVRRGPLPKKTLHLLGWSAAALVFACVAGVFGAELYQYGERNWRFRIESSDDIEVNGTHNVPRAQIMEVMGGDIGRNIFFIPLSERKAQLEKIPWVASASVMRFVPNRLQIDIRERTPDCVCARRTPDLIDRRGRHFDGIAERGQAEVFVPRNRRHECRRAAFDPLSAHENL